MIGFANLSGAEARKADGKEYTPRSLYLLLCALQRYIREVRPSEDTNLFQQPVFRPLKNVCVAVFKRLHNKGIGTDTKVTPVLYEDEENTLRKKEVSLWIILQDY